MYMGNMHTHTTVSYEPKVVTAQYVYTDTETGLTYCLMRLLEMIMTLGGSPMAVAVPPMLENTTSAMSTGRGSRFST